MPIDTSPADYLFGASREPLLRIFWDRQNAPLEFSALRVALEAHGIAAHDANHWGLLAALLRGDPRHSDTHGHPKGATIIVVGREQAIAASRNDAKNNVYQLHPDIWTYVAQIHAPARHWPIPPAPVAQPQQTALVS